MLAGHDDVMYNADEGEQMTQSGRIRALQKACPVLVLG